MYLIKTDFYFLLFWLGRFFYNCLIILIFFIVWKKVIISINNITAEI